MYCFISRIFWNITDTEEEKVKDIGMGVVAVMSSDRTNIIEFDYITGSMEFFRQ